MKWMCFLRLFSILIELKVEGIDLIGRKWKEYLYDFNIFEFGNFFDIYFFRYNFFRWVIFNGDIGI